MPDSDIHDYNVQAVNSSVNRELYKKREPIYPKLVHGKYRLIKWILLIFTLSVYYGLPWLRWPRGAHEPDQAVLVDFAGQRFYFFFIEIWPDELYFVTGLLILAALCLFLVTSLFGRLWCGYACPQTVWTDLFIVIERLVEGDRNKRMRLANQPWTFHKISKKGIKHSLWLLTAAATGGAWVLYFHDAPTVVSKLIKGTAPLTAYLFFAILTVATYMLAGLMREQVCIYMCPWPRIQAAMTDADTFMVGYYQARGEPRGKHKKGESWELRGDCIDCKACVVACPMGIDIREGDQLECINCGLCADACDDIMKKVDRPIGLIAYGSEYRLAQQGKARRRFPKFMRPRSLFYGVSISIVSILMLIGLTSRATVEFNIQRNRTPAFTVLSDGSIRNALVVKILNKESVPRDFRVHFNGTDNLQVTAIGYDVEQNAVTLKVPGDQVQSVRLFLTLPAVTARRNSMPIEVQLIEITTGISVSKKINFIQEGT